MLWCAERRAAQMDGKGSNQASSFPFEKAFPFKRPGELPWHGGFDYHLATVCTAWMFPSHHFYISITPVRMFSSPVEIFPSHQFQNFHHISFYFSITPVSIYPSHQFGYSHYTNLNIIISLILLLSSV